MRIIEVYTKSLILGSIFHYFMAKAFNFFLSFQVCKKMYSMFYKNRKNETYSCSTSKVLI